MRVIPNTKSITTRLFHFVLTTGRKKARDRAERRLNKVTNWFFLIFLCLSIFLIITVLGIHFQVRSIYPEYPNYLHYYLPGPIGMIVILVIGLVLRRWSRIPDEYMNTIGFLYGIGLVVHLSLLMGKESNVYLFLLFFYVLPFLLNGRNNRVLIGFWIFAATCAFGIIFFLHSQGMDPLAPLPDETILFVQFVNSVFMIFTLTACVFYFWSESAETEHSLEILNKRLVKQSRAIQTELTLASNIQLGTMPASEYNWKSITIKTSFLPVQKVSGDYFDIFERQGKLYILLADISGHGIPAALITMLAKQTFTGLIDEGLPLSKVLELANLDLYEKVITRDYLTLCLLSITGTGKLSYCIAGHPNPILIPNDKEREIRNLDTKGAVIGAIEKLDGHFEEASLQLQNGDRVLLYSDGLTQQSNSDGIMFGNDRLSEIITTKTPDLNTSLINAMWDFSQASNQKDDITVMSVEFHGNGS